RWTFRRWNGRRTRLRNRLREAVGGGYAPTSCIRRERGDWPWDTGSHERATRASLTTLLRRLDNDRPCDRGLPLPAILIPGVQPDASRPPLPPRRIRRPGGRCRRFRPDHGRPAGGGRAGGDPAAGV